jgi:phosphohistidine phosphatase SixA
MNRRRCVSSLFALVLQVLVPAQAPTPELPPPSWHEIAAPAAGEALPYLVQLPPGHTAEGRWPLLLLLPDGAADEAAAAAALQEMGVPAARRGFVVVVPATATGEDQLGALCAQLRQTHRIDQGGMHLAGGGDGMARAMRAAQRHRAQFQSLTVWGGVWNEHSQDLMRLPLTRRGRMHVFHGERVDRGQHFVSVHGARALSGPAGDVARTLDEFHDAAATGDEARYFAILPDDAVFLGTDGTERWTGAEFREFAIGYFERGPAWTYVPMARNVTVAEGGALAWFDEVLDNDAYGECRGTGVLALRDGAWVLRQYNLTVPVPNDLMRGTAERIRAFTDGRPPTETTVVVVRHAEKQGSEGDVDLSAAGVARSVRLQQTLDALDVQAVYTSEFRRTAATVAPLCQAKGLEPQVVPAALARRLVDRIREQHRGQTVVVAGHSNTVPKILRALGVTTPVEIGDDEYDHLFVVTLSADGVRLLGLRYGGS